MCKTKHSIFRVTQHFICHFLKFMLGPISMQENTLTLELKFSKHVIFLLSISHESKRAASQVYEQVASSNLAQNFVQFKLNLHKFQGKCNNFYTWQAACTFILPFYLIPVEKALSADVSDRVITKNFIAYFFSFK